MKTDYTVILVVARSYGEQLQNLPLGVPAWVVKSPSNEPFIKKLWNESPNADRFTGITSFNDTAETTPDELAASMLDIIEEHHPQWNTLQIIGTQMTKSLDETLNELGFFISSEGHPILEYRRPTG